MAQCRHETCEAEFKDHRWGRIKAHDAGWFEQKDGTAWCPEHNPPWVAEWRASQDIARPEKDTIVLTAQCISCTLEIRKPLGEGQTWVHVDTGEVDC